MFEEGCDGKLLFQPSIKGKHVQYNASALPQFQLFGQFTVGCSGNAIDYAANEHGTASIRPVKRVRDAELNNSQQMLRISLNNSSCQDEVGQAGSILNPNPVSTGLRLSYEEEERNSSVTSDPESMKAALPAFLLLDNAVKCEIDSQRVELDHYIEVQEENMLKGLRDLHNQHTVSFLNALGNGINKKLFEKELEIENLNRKNRELGERIKQVSMETQSWHYKSKYNESLVTALKSNIQKLMTHGVAQAKEGSGDSEIDDTASTADHMALASGSGYQTPRKQQVNCRACKSKEVSVLLLPCRHLTLCIDCDGFIDSCPACKVMKTASFQVYMS